MSDVRLRNGFVAVKVPAVNANLGPGFDSMGLALDLWDEVSIHATAGVTSVVAEGEGAGNVERGGDNLVVCALRLALGRVGTLRVSVCTHCTNCILCSRGLGSSTNVTVTGATLAHALIGDAGVLGRREILVIGPQMEGHLDSVAPVVFGGTTVSWMDDETSKIGSVRLTPLEGISSVAFIPNFELRTAVVRVALSVIVPHGDASFNVARGALLATVLSGNAQTDGGANLHALLMETTRDRLHQEQHRATMEPSLALTDWLRDTGFAVITSGVGPTVLPLESAGADTRRNAAAVR